MSARKRRAPKANAYSLAKPIASGTVILDTHKRKWIVGMPVAQGGFGCIYSAKLSGEDRDNFVAKIEPQKNGPLFTEIHFYLRACTQDSISKWKSQHGLSFLGIPRYVSSGLFTPPGQTPCRFLMMDRYTGDFESVLKQGKIQPANVIKAAYNVLNALEYLHSKDYAHADIKAANLLYTNCFEEVTLVDFGLVHLFRVNGVHCSAKPDAKFKHNGTLEFCSRDAHSGLPPSRRGDLEILLYNIIHWLARCQPGAAQSHSTGLPWGHLIADPKLRAEVPDRVRVQVATLKEQAMQNVECMFSGVGLQSNPDFTRFMLAVKQLGYDETPNYQRLRHYLLAFHKQLTLDTIKTKNVVSAISSKRDVTGHTSKVSGGPSGTKINAVDINNGNVKSTTGEVPIPIKRPRGRPQGTTNSGHLKESTTVVDGAVVDSFGKPIRTTSKK
ncbi:hypothetical protein P879_04721 [Paragonimus westermani]|uniref:non-specific serine/threonine protein kinase n=1 Tax=Paragonimus westermani TaxID=34504 RepID=A0A8T0D428_9TREM|nr:hypothetical protein P879_04721 [Paragonimus westermani]